MPGGSRFRRGATRWVLLVGPYAVKVPSLRGWRDFLWGLLGNLQEAEFSRLGWERLCPVVASLPLGLMVVMRRASPRSTVAATLRSRPRRP